MAKEGATRIRECCGARTPSVCWGALSEQMYSLGKEATQEPMATLPPASLFFILTPEEPGAQARGSSLEAGRAAAKAGQS